MRKILIRNGSITVLFKNRKQIYATLHFQGQFKFLIPFFLLSKQLLGPQNLLLFQTKIAMKLLLIKNVFFGK